LYPEPALFPCFVTVARRKIMLEAIEREFEGTLTYILEPLLVTKP
jgi:hypothetical protein